MTRPEPAEPTIFVVDDDDAMRESLEFLLESVGLKARAFAAAEDFLDVFQAGTRGCLLLDVRMPGMGGLELQEALRAKGIDIPVIIMTGYADVPMAVRAMQAGALDFIEKPLNEQRLLERVRKAIEHEKELNRARDQIEPIRERIASLTPREHDVLKLVVAGCLNKQIARQLDLSMKTVEQHRARVMIKMEADSLAELVRMAITAGEL